MKFELDSSEATHRQALAYLVRIASIAGDQRLAEYKAARDAFNEAAREESEEK